MVNWQITTWKHNAINAPVADILKINDTFFINHGVNYLLNFVDLNFHRTLQCLSIVWLAI